MGMNPRLLRPTASTLDKDAAVYLNAVAAADQQQLEPAVRKAINDFVIGCKRDGIWDPIKASCILMGARTLSGALTPLKGGSPTNVSNNFVSGDYDRKTGLKGNANNKSLDTGRAGNADGQNDKHAAVYVTEATSAATGFRVYYGTLFSGGQPDHVVERGNTSASDLTSRFHSTTSDAITGAGAATGFIGSSRSGSASYVFRHSGSNSTITRTSSSVGSATYRIFTNGTSALLHSDGRISFYSIGTAVDLALLDARLATLYNAIGGAF
jgi:hypothetical protein